jgi:hypothetical protein
MHMNWLNTVIAGWKQVRHVGGHSYQSHDRAGRRIVREPGFKQYGERDEHWLRTGHWSEEAMKDSSTRTSPHRATRRCETAASA